jgi:hypothetical protein
MQKHVLLLATSAVMLTWGTIAASAQAMTPGGPMTPQEPQTLQQQLERQLQGVQTQRHSFEDDRDQDDFTHDGGMMGWGYGPDWRRQWGWRRGVMDPGMMDPGMMDPGMMGQGGRGPGGMGAGMMMRMLFILTDTDGDGTISLQEFRRLTSGSSGRWMPIKMAALPWRKFRPSCREPGDRFRGNDLITAVSGRSHQPTPRRSACRRRDLCPIPDGRLRRGWLACIRRNPPICRRIDRVLKGEEPAALPVQAPAARAPYALVVSDIP